MDLDVLFIFLFLLISCSGFFWMFLTVCFSVGGFGCLCESFVASSYKTVSFGLVGCLRVWCRESCLSRGLVLMAYTISHVFCRPFAVFRVLSQGFVF